MLLCVGEGRQSLHHVPLRVHWAKTVEEKASRAQERGNLLHFLSSADQISTLERYNGCKTYVFEYTQKQTNDHPSSFTAGSLRVAMATSNAGARL